MNKLTRNVTPLSETAGWLSKLGILTGSTADFATERKKTSVSYFEYQSLVESDRHCDCVKDQSQIGDLLDNKSQPLNNPGAATYPIKDQLKINYLQAQFHAWVYVFVGLKKGLYRIFCVRLHAGLEMKASVALI